jgi:hypothetical protein
MIIQLVLIQLILTVEAAEKLTPLSNCVKASVTAYKEWEEGGNCHFGQTDDELGDWYEYGTAGGFHNDSPAFLSVNVF